MLIRKPVINVVYAIFLICMSASAFTVYAQNAKQYIKLLQSEDYSVRDRAISSLAELKDPGATRPLLKLLKEQDVDLRLHVIKALGIIGDRRAIDPLILQLKDKTGQLKTTSAFKIDPKFADMNSRFMDESYRINAAAALALGAFPDSKVTEALIEALKSNSYTVTLNAVSSLGQAGDTVAVVPLIQSYGYHDHDPARTAIVTALNRMENHAIKVLIDSLASSEAAMRITAIDILGEMRSDTAVEPIIGLLYASDSQLTGPCLRALGKIKNSRAIKILEEAVLSGDKETSVTAVNVMNAIDAPLEGSLLIDLLKKDDPDLTLAVANAFIKLGPSAIGVLMPAAKDSFLVLRRQAIDILGRIPNPGIKKCLEEALADSDPEIRKSACKALYKNYPDSLKAFPSPAVYEELRPIIIEAMGIPGDLTNIRYLSLCLKDKNPEIRRIAIKSLGTIGKPAVVDLVALLASPDSLENSGATNALVMIGEPAIAALAAAINGQFPLAMKARCAECLGLIGLPAFDALNHALSNADYQSYDLCLSALAQIGNPVIEPMWQELLWHQKQMQEQKKDFFSRGGTNQTQYYDELYQVYRNNFYVHGEHLVKVTSLIGPGALDKVVATMRSYDDEVADCITRAMAKMKGHSRTHLENAINNRDLQFVAKAYRYYIDQSDEKSIQVLIDALNACGTMSMAADYLNCANTKLAQAAQSWAERHGYVIRYATQGGGGPVWRNHR